MVDDDTKQTSRRDALQWVVPTGSQNRQALITGGDSSIGRAAAIAYDVKARTRLRLASGAAAILIRNGAEQANF
jgi:hypothetical protein